MIEYYKEQNKAILQEIYNSNLNFVYRANRIFYQIRELKIPVSLQQQLCQITNQFNPKTTIISNIITEIELIIKENKKLLIEAFTIKQYEKIIEIIITSIKRQTSVPLTTFATVGRPIKQNNRQNQNYLSLTNSPSSSSGSNLSRRPQTKTPPNRKDFREYIEEIKKYKYKGNNYRFYD